MKLRGIRRTVLALALGMGAVAAFWSGGQHHFAAAPTQHRVAGEAMPPIPQAQSVFQLWNS
jgi:hypothetical protein